MQNERKAVIKMFHFVSGLALEVTCGATAAIGLAIVIGLGLRPELAQNLVTIPYGETAFLLREVTIVAYGTMAAALLSLGVTGIEQIASDIRKVK